MRGGAGGDGEWGPGRAGPGGGRRGRDGPRDRGGAGRDGVRRLAKLFEVFLLLGFS